MDSNDKGQSQLPPNSSVSTTVGATVLPSTLTVASTSTSSFISVHQLSQQQHQQLVTNQQLQQQTLASSLNPAPPVVITNPVVSTAASSAPPTTAGPGPVVSPVKLLLEQPAMSMSTPSSSMVQSISTSQQVKVQHSALHTLLLPSGSSQHTQYQQQLRQQQAFNTQFQLHSQQQSHQLVQQQQSFQQQKLQLQQQQQLQLQQKQQQQQKLQQQQQSIQQFQQQQQSQQLQQNLQQIQQQQQLQQQQKLQKQQQLKKQQQQQQQQQQHQQLQQQQLQQQQQQEQLHQQQQFGENNSVSVSNLALGMHIPPAAATAGTGLATTSVPVPLTQVSLPAPMTTTPLPISVLTPTHRPSVSPATIQTGHRSRKEKLICRVSTDSDHILVQSSPSITHPSLHHHIDLAPSDHPYQTYAAIDPTLPSFPSLPGHCHPPLTLKIKKNGSPAKTPRPYNRKKSNSVGSSSSYDLFAPAALTSPADKFPSSSNQPSDKGPEKEKKSKASLSKKVLLSNAQKRLTPSGSASNDTPLAGTTGNPDDPNGPPPAAPSKSKKKEKTKDTKSKEKDPNKPPTKRQYKRKNSVKLEFDAEGNPIPIPSVDSPAKSNKSKSPTRSPRGPLSPSKATAKATKDKGKGNKRLSKSKSPISIGSSEPVIKVPSGSNRNSGSPSGSPLKFAKFSRSNQGLSEQETALLPMLSKPGNASAGPSSSSSATASATASQLNKNRHRSKSPGQSQSLGPAGSGVAPSQSQAGSQARLAPVAAADLKFFGPPGVLPIFKPNQKPWNLLKRLMEGNESDSEGVKTPISPKTRDKEFDLDTSMDVDGVGAESKTAPSAPFTSFDVEDEDEDGSSGDSSSSDESEGDSSDADAVSDDSSLGGSEADFSEENVTELDVDLDEEDIEDLEVVAVPIETVDGQLAFTSDDRALFEKLLLPESPRDLTVPTVPANSVPNQSSSQSSRRRMISERSHSINSMDELNGDDSLPPPGQSTEGQLSSASANAFPHPLPIAPNFGGRPSISMAAAVSSAAVSSIFNSVSSESPSPTTEPSCPTFPQPIPISHASQSRQGHYQGQPQNQQQALPESYQFTPIHHRETPPSPSPVPMTAVPSNSSSAASAAAKWAFGQSQYQGQNGHGRESPCGTGTGSNSNSNSGYGLQHRFQPPSPSPSSVSSSSNNGGNSGKRYSRRRHSRMYPPFETSHCMFSKHFCPAPLEPGSTYCIKHVSEKFSPYYVRCAFTSGKTGRRCQNMQYSRDGKNKFCNMHATRLALLRQKLYRKPRPAKRIRDYFGDIRRIQNKLKKPNRTEAAAYLEDYCDYKLQTQCMENEIETEEPMEMLVTTESLSKFQAEHDSDGGIDIEDEYECLKNAGYYTTEEVVRILKSKLSKLRELYIKEFDFLKFYYLMKRQDFLVAEDTIKAAGVKYSRNPKTLYRFKNVIGEEFIKKEFKGYEKTKTLLNYHKLRGQLAVLHHMGRQRYEDIKEKEEKDKLHTHSTSALPGDANDAEDTETDLSDEEDQGNPIVREVMEHSKHSKARSKSPTARAKKCKFQAEYIKCENMPLPSAKYCHKHILKDDNQVLFEPCNYPTDQNEWCVLPLLKKIDRSGCDFHRIFRLKRFRKNKKEKKNYDKVLRGMPKANLKEQMRLLEELIASKMNSVEEFDSEIDYLRQKGLDCSDTSNSDIDNDFEYEDGEDEEPPATVPTVPDISPAPTQNPKISKESAMPTRRRKRSAPAPAPVETLEPVLDEPKLKEQKLDVPDDSSGMEIASSSSDAKQIDQQVTAAEKIKSPLPTSQDRDDGESGSSGHGHGSGGKEVSAQDCGLNSEGKNVPPSQPHGDSDSASLPRTRDCQVKLRPIDGNGSGSGSIPGPASTASMSEGNNDRTETTPPVGPTEKETKEIVVLLDKEEVKRHGIE